VNKEKKQFCPLRNINGQEEKKRLQQMTIGENNNQSHPSSPTGGQGAVLIQAEEMKAVFRSILLQEGFAGQKAEALADVFTANSVDGVYTHGVNRFPVFVQYVKDGWIDKHAEPTKQAGFNGIEQLNGNLGPGPLNAMAATDRAMQLAQEFGIGCVALGNTNHWMRGGSYGWQAAKKGFVLIAWTNTIALMPAWGAMESKLGNNPLVMALPYGEEAIVLDMAMSQYSFGAMELAAAKGENLAVNGGYDREGNLTTDPAAIMASKRPLPIGYWKGAGLSLLLDILAAILSGGLATHQITGQQKECSLSQVFVCIDITKLPQHSLIEKAVKEVINDYHLSKTDDGGKKVRFPGERVLHTRNENLRKGIPVLPSKWEDVLKLQA
jgi:3-dehydro-L-gulonate 2-dehydrogenase